MHFARTNIIRPLIAQAHRRVRALPPEVLVSWAESKGYKRITLPLRPGFTPDPDFVYFEAPQAVRDIPHAFISREVEPARFRIGINRDFVDYAQFWLELIGEWCEAYAEPVGNIWACLDELEDLVQSAAYWVACVTDEDEAVTPCWGPVQASTEERAASGYIYLLDDASPPEHPNAHELVLVRRQTEQPEQARTYRVERRYVVRDGFVRREYTEARQ